MATLVYAAGTSHGPHLGAPPELWAQRGEQDKTYKALYAADGEVRSYDELVALAAGRYDKQATYEQWQQDWQRSQADLDRLRADFARVAPDVVLIVGDDQQEIFSEANTPALAIGGAATMTTATYDDKDILRSEFFTAAAPTFLMDKHHSLVGSPDLARDIAAHLNELGFDIAWLAGSENYGHAVGFPIYRLLSSQSIPVIPVLTNTFFPPNQPTPRRCFEFGRALRAAVEASPIEARVAIVASGGLSHFVVDEDLDNTVMTALRANDYETLCSLPAKFLNSGNSEIRNWIIVAGAMEGRPVDWSDYVSVVRSPAGTGCGLGFISWK